MIQLSYLSTATRPMGAELLSALLQQCLGYNSGSGITGLLLYGNGTFLQALEGGEYVVTPLYEKIARDPRHADVKCLNIKTIETRQYSEWSMGFRRVAEGDLADVAGMRDFNKANFNADFLAANAEAREDIMSHYASWDPLLREVDEGERHVKHLQEVLRRAHGGIEIARLVLPGSREAHRFRVRLRPRNDNLRRDRPLSPRDRRRLLLPGVLQRPDDGGIVSKRDPARSAGPARPIMTRNEQPGFDPASTTRI